MLCYKQHQNLPFPRNNVYNNNHNNSKNKSQNSNDPVMQPEFKIKIDIPHLERFELLYLKLQVQKDPTTGACEFSILFAND